MTASAQPSVKRCGNLRSMVASVGGALALILAVASCGSPGADAPVRDGDDAGFSTFMRDEGVSHNADEDAQLVDTAYKICDRYASGATSEDIFGAAYDEGVNVEKAASVVTGTELYICPEYDLPTEAAAKLLPQQDAGLSSKTTAPPKPVAGSIAPAPAATREPPTLTMNCPAAFQGDATSVDTVFGYEWRAYEPFTVKIDYGDGRSYENTDQHLGDVFSHSYTAPGTYTVVASLTDAQGATVQASCVSSWISASYSVPVAPYTGGGYAVTCSDGWTSQSGGKSGACSSHGGIG